MSQKQEITLEHIKQACEWAEKAAKEIALPIDGLLRKYDQSEWDCGTACCIWGAASIISGNGPAKEGPPSEWSDKDFRHTLVAGLLRSPSSTPGQIQDLLNLDDANLRGADLQGADLRGAEIMIGNISRKIATS